MFGGWWGPGEAKEGEGGLVNLLQMLTFEERGVGDGKLML